MNEVIVFTPKCNKLSKKLHYILSFFLVFCYQLGQIFISNILIIISFIYQIIKDKKIVYTSQSKSRIVLIFFLIYVTLNSVYYSIFIKEIDVRGLIQYFYNFQYFFLVVYIDLDYNFLKKQIFNFSLLLSSILILHFFISGDGLELFKWNQIAIDYYPGWSNTIPLYLIFSLYINRNKKRSQFYNYILILAIFITGSRGARLGGISIFLLPLIKRLSKYYFLLISSIIFILCLLIFIVINFENELPFFRAFDRIDIFLTSISYIEKSFLFGYGGNTIEQLSYVQISHEPIKDWGHTHNFLLEFALRYGIIGLILFILFIYNKIKEIKDFDSKYFFIIFIILAIFQTFMRDFTFLSILIIISNSLHLKQYTPLYSKNQH